MDELTVTLPEQLRDRLAEVAARVGQPLETCLAQAVEEYVEHWETHLRDVDTFNEEEDGGDRPVLKAANE